MQRNSFECVLDKSICIQKVRGDQVLTICESKNSKNHKKSKERFIRDPNKQDGATHHDSIILLSSHSTSISTNIKHIYAFNCVTTIHLLCCCWFFCCHHQSGL